MTNAFANKKRQRVLNQRVLTFERITTIIIVIVVSIIFIGDAVVQVNDNVLGDISHDEALTLLASAGPKVTLVLKHYKAATPFLLKQFGR